MTWIRTVHWSQADGPLKEAIEYTRAFYPAEYAEPTHPTDDGTVGRCAGEGVASRLPHGADRQS